jgi:hypothetical protein
MNVLMEEEIRFWLEKCVLMYDLGPRFKVMRSSTFHFIPNAVRDVTERCLNWNGSQKGALDRCHESELSLSRTYLNLISTSFFVHLTTPCQQELHSST